MTLRCVVGVLFAFNCFHSALSQRNRGGLPKPTPCRDGSNFCGEDSRRYPERKIQEIVESSISDSPLTADQFLTARSDFREVDPINPACASRTQDIPRLARAKNTKGKWKYLIQQRGEEVQHFQVTFCEKAGSKCINDEDRPEVNGITTCKQAYKMQKMLAVDESGQVTVDSFSLPSACLCHFVTDPPFPTGPRVRSSDPDPDPIRDGTKKAVSVRNAFANEEPPIPNCVLESEPITRTVKKSQQSRGRDSSAITFGGRRRRAPISNSGRKPSRGGSNSRPDFLSADGFQSGTGRSTSRGRLTSGVPECPNGVALCSDDDNRGRGGDREVELVLSRSAEFGSPDKFEAVFGPTCRDDPGAEVRTTVGVRTSFDLRSTALCTSYTDYIYPKKGKTANGRDYRYIVNTPKYPQGVAIDICHTAAEGESCTYDGQSGKFPHATKCRQQYSSHRMLALTEDGRDVYVETFSIPSACICSITDPEYFDP